MNSIHDLEDEFARLATGAPEVSGVRTAIAVGLSKREKRRRTTALVAVAASVVLVAGGIGVTRALVSGPAGDARPAAPASVVSVPQVPLPEGTQLIRHALQPVESPVTATPPEGLTGLNWIQTPGRLSVSWFDPAAAGTVMGPAAYTPLSDSQALTVPKTVGYVITGGPDDPVTAPVWMPGKAQVESRDITVSGHPATLDSAPEGAFDAMGFPAQQRISWQLPDERYIHVWASGVPTRTSSPDTALLAFAESITETPFTLPRAVGVGLTLPGLTMDSSMNSNPANALVVGMLWLCKPGIDPITNGGSASGSSSVGSASAVAGPTASTVAPPTPAPDGLGADASSADGLGVGSTSGVAPPTPGMDFLPGADSPDNAAPGNAALGSASYGPGAEFAEQPAASAPQADQPESDVQKSCVIVGVMNGGAMDGQGIAGQSIDAAIMTTIAGSRVKAMPQLSAAQAELPGGLLAVVAAPRSAHLSADDLAALASSVRLSPDVRVIPVDASAQYRGELESGSASAVASSSMATPRGPIELPIIVLRDAAHPVGISEAPAGGTGTISFYLQNVTGEPVTIDAISLGDGVVESGGPVLVNGNSGSLTLAAARGRLDNVPSDADTPLVDITTPMVLAPGARVYLELTFDIGQCGDLPPADVPLGLNYSTGNGTGNGTGTGTGNGTGTDSGTGNGSGASTSSGGGFSLPDALGLPRWVHDLTQLACR